MIASLFATSGGGHLVIGNTIRALDQSGVVLGEMPANAKLSAGLALGLGLSCDEPITDVITSC